jgi:hypothetical protein
MPLLLCVCLLVHNSEWETRLSLEKSQWQQELDAAIAQV